MDYENIKIIIKQNFQKNEHITQKNKNMISIVSSYIKTKNLKYLFWVQKSVMMFKTSYKTEKFNSRLVQF
jgi:hypothetical protein